MYYEDSDKVFAAMNGEVIAAVTGMYKGSDEVGIEMVSGRTFKMWHSQDCCERVYLEDVVGNPDDLVGYPCTVWESTNANEPAPPEADNSYTWTFYTFRTVKGTVVLRWLGQSNGYYSESVDVVETTPEGDKPVAVRL
jgi:hypothetical protein